MDVTQKQIDNVMQKAAEDHKKEREVLKNRYGNIYLLCFTMLNFYCLLYLMEFRSVGFVDLFRTGPQLRARTMNLFFNWFVNGAAYYGLSLSSYSFGGKGSPYFKFFLSAAVEIPAFTLNLLLLNNVSVQRENTNGKPWEIVFRLAKVWPSPASLWPPRDVRGCASPRRCRPHGMLLGHHRPLPRRKAGHLLRLRGCLRILGRAIPN